MFKSFDEIELYALEHAAKKRVALAGSQDVDALSAVVMARRKGAIEATLVGDEETTRKHLADLNESADCYSFVHEPSGPQCARIACDMVRNKEADIPMKGAMQTAEFLKAVLDKNLGFVSEKTLITQATVFEYKKEDRLMIVTDCAIAITPDYDDKIKIVTNAVKLANRMRNNCPKVAIVAPVETVNPAMQSTIDAAMLSKACQRGQIKGCVIDGPLGLDNAVSLEAARHKGIVSDVAGMADILIMPDICAGNIFTKSLTYFGDLRTGAAMNGTTSPVVMTSRTDSSEDKYRSILLATL